MKQHLPLIRLDTSKFVSCSIVDRKRLISIKCITINLQYPKKRKLIFLQRQFILSIEFFYCLFGSVTGPNNFQCLIHTKLIILTFYLHLHSVLPDLTIFRQNGGQIFGYFSKIARKPFKLVFTMIFDADILVFWEACDFDAGLL